MTNAELLAEAKTMYNLYVEAEKVVLTGQSYTIKDRTLTRADLGLIRQGRAEWLTKIQTLEPANPLATSGGGIRVKRVIPRDN